MIQRRKYYEATEGCQFTRESRNSSRDRHVLHGKLNRVTFGAAQEGLITFLRGDLRILEEESTDVEIPLTP